jgi:hypothetical protein
MPRVLRVFRVSHAAVSLVSGLYSLGMAAGAVVSGALYDRQGAPAMFRLAGLAMAAVVALLALYACCSALCGVSVGGGGGGGGGGGVGGGGVDGGGGGKKGGGLESGVVRAEGAGGGGGAREPLLHSDSAYSSGSVVAVAGERASFGSQPSIDT